MKFPARTWAVFALFPLLAACASAPSEVTPEARAPTSEEAAEHNATAPQAMQIVCEMVSRRGTNLRQRTCWLRQDMGLRVNQRNTVLVPVTP